jgi:hypothetical protein
MGWRKKLCLALIQSSLGLLNKYSEHLGKVGTEKEGMKGSYRYLGSVI